MSSYMLDLLREKLSQGAPGSFPEIFPSSLTAMLLLGDFRPEVAAGAGSQGQPTELRILRPEHEEEEDSSNLSAYAGASRSWFGRRDAKLYIGRD